MHGIPDGTNLQNHSSGTFAPGTHQRGVMVNGKLGLVLIQVGAGLDKGEAEIPWQSRQDLLLFRYTNDNFALREGTLQTRLAAFDFDRKG